MGAGGAFTGSLTFHGIAYSLRGAFVAAENGTFIWNGVIHRPGLPDLNVSLQFDPRDPSGAITGSISDDTDSAPISLARAGFDVNHPTALAGSYTVMLPANPDFPGSGFPQGDGYALLTVTADGTVRFTGKLGDGTMVSQSGALAADGRFAVYLPLYGGRGALSGWVDFQPVDDVSDFNGTLHWSKTGAAGGPLYAAGFDLEVDLMGSRFLPPLPGHRILNLENRPNNSVLLLGEGNLDPSFNFAATLDTANMVRTAAPAATAFKMTIAPTSGLFTGTFLHPGTKKSTAFSGVVFQKQNLATGVFAGSSKSGYVSLRRSALSLVLLPPASSGASSSGSGTTPAAKVVRFSDNFDDSVLDPAKWTATGNSISEGGQILNVLTTVTDAGGTIVSAPFPISRTGLLTVRRKVRLHYANDKFIGRLGLRFGTLPQVDIFYGNMEYNDSNLQSLHGIYLSRDGSNPHFRDYNPANSAGPITPLWDEWFDEKVTYQPSSGALEYFINGVSRLTFNVGSLPPGSSPTMELSANAWGWWTGHEQLIDDLVVEQN